LARQAKHLNEVKLDLLLPEFSISISPTDSRVVKQFRMMRFSGARWESLGPIVAD
jgi:hypothetical protein